VFDGAEAPPPQAANSALISPSARNSLYLISPRSCHSPEGYRDGVSDRKERHLHRTVFGAIQVRISALLRKLLCNRRFFIATLLTRACARCRQNDTFGLYFVRNYAFLFVWIVAGYDGDRFFCIADVDRLVWNIGRDKDEIPGLVNDRL